MRAKNPEVRGHVAIFVANFIFGVNVPLAKTVVSDAGVSWQAASLVRIAVAALLFWVVSLFTPRERVSRRDLGLLFFGESLCHHAQSAALSHGAGADLPV